MPLKPNPASAASPLKQLDGEHRVQFALLRALADSLQGEAGEVTLAELVEQCVSYSELHFMSEQLLMRLYAYPEYEEHLRDHETMIELLHTLQAQHASEDRDAMSRSVKRFRELLLGHLRGRDRALDTYLQQVSQDGERPPLD